MSSIDTKGNSNLTEVNAYRNKITAANFEGNIKLQKLCGVGHAELDDQVVADVEVGQQGGVGNVDVGQTVAEARPMPKP